MKKSFSVFHISHNVIRLLSVKRSSRAIDVLIDRSMELETGESNDPSFKARIVDFIEDCGCSGTAALILLSGNELEHEVMTVPPMADKELRHVFHRERLRKEQRMNQPLVSDYQVVGMVREKGLQRMKILWATYPVELMRLWLETLTAAGISPVRMTTAPAATGDYLSSRTSQQPALSAVIAPAARHTDVMIFQGALFSFHREIPIGMETFSKDNAEQKALKQVIAETERTFQYYAKKMPGETVSHVYLAGIYADEYQMADVFGQSLDVDSATPLYLDETVLGPNEERRSIADPVILPALEPQKKALNLIPYEYYEAKNTGKRRAFYIAVSLLFLIALFAGSTALKHAEHSYRASCEQQQKTLQRIEDTIDKNLGSVRKIQKYQRQIEEILRLSENEIDLRPALYVFFAQAPDGSEFDKLEIRKQKNGWAALLEGNIYAPDASAAQSRFNEFHQKVEDSGRFTLVDIKQLEVNTDRKSAGTRKKRPSSDDLKQKMPVQLHFSIESLLADINQTRTQDSALRNS